MREGGQGSTVGTSGDERGLGATSVRAGVASPAGFGVIGRTRGGLLDMPSWTPERRLGAA